MIALVDRREIFLALSLWQRFVISVLQTVGLFVVGWLTLCALDKELPLEVTGIKAAPPVVGVGQPVFVTFEVVRRKVCFTRGESAVIDAAGVRWPFDPTPWRVVSDRLGPDTATIRFVIPPNATPGPAKFRLVYYQRCALNPFQFVWPLVDVADEARFDIVSAVAPAVGAGPALEVPSAPPR